MFESQGPTISVKDKKCVFLPNIIFSFYTKENTKKEILQNVLFPLGKNTSLAMNLCELY